MRLFPFTPIRFVPPGTKFSFVSHMRLAVIETIVLAVLTVGLLSTYGLNYGVDFRGGTLIEIQNKAGPADIAALRTKLNDLNLGDVQIQGFGSPSEVLIRVGADEDQSGQQAVTKIREALGDTVEYRRIETVGATVSQELIQTAIISLIIAALGIATYLWMRFEWQFSVSAIIALLHDLAVVLCFLSITQMQFDLTVVAALLTLIGYAVNDTVVTFDRVRENLRRFKRMPLPDLIDLSVNETLSRTAMTGGAIILALFALFLFGGEVISGFTTVMLLGALVSAYTSMFVAAPFLALVGVKRDWSGLGRDTPAAASRGSGGAAGQKASAAARADDADEALPQPGRPAAEALALEGAALAQATGDPAAPAKAAGSAAQKAAPKPNARRGRGRAKSGAKAGAPAGAKR